MARKALRMASVAYKLLQLETSSGEAILADEIGFKGTLDLLVEFRTGFSGLANRPGLLLANEKKFYPASGNVCSSSSPEEANRGRSSRAPKHARIARPSAGTTSKFNTAQDTEKPLKSVPFFPHLVS